MFIDIIRQAESEHEIYFLLTAYLEAVQFSDKLKLLPDSMERLPIASIDSVQERFRKLIVELDKASKELNDNACAVIKEAMCIFNAALNRLESLAGRQDPALAGRRKHELRQMPLAGVRKPSPPDLQGEIRVD